jgi:hypothetical protein
MSVPAISPKYFQKSFLSRQNFCPVFGADCNYYQRESHCAARYCDSLTGGMLHAHNGPVQPMSSSEYFATRISPQLLGSQSL